MVTLLPTSLDKELGTESPSTVFKPGARRPRAWFPKIDLVRMSVCVCVCVCVCMCPPPRLLITSGMMWRDIDLM